MTVFCMFRIIVQLKAVMSMKFDWSIQSIQVNIPTENRSDRCNMNNTDYQKIGFQTYESPCIYNIMHMLVYLHLAAGICNPIQCLVVGYHIPKTSNF